MRNSLCRYVATLVRGRTLVTRASPLSRTPNSAPQASSGYADSATATLAAGATDTLTFTDWAAGTAGTYAVKCTTELAGDEDSANDLVEDSVIVRPSAGISEGRSLPLAFSLDQVLPNPTGGRASIRYGLPRPAVVNLSVYSTAGTLVNTITNGTQSPGWYTVTWDGRDSRNRKVGAGIYLLRLEAGPFTSTRKLVVQR